MKIHSFVLQIVMDAAFKTRVLPGSGEHVSIALGFFCLINVTGLKYLCGGVLVARSCLFRS